MKNEVTIIMYHFVRDLARSRYPEIKGLDLELFNHQLLYLLKHYNIIRMEDLISAFETQTELPSHAALLTFDDAYIDQYSNVFPLLSKYHIQGSFYPPVKAITDHVVLDVNKIHFVLASVENKALLVDEIFELLDHYRANYELGSKAFYYNKLAKKNRMDSKEIILIKRLLQAELPESLRLKIIHELFNKYVSNDEASFAQELYMSETQIEHMQSCGMHIGSHGHNHYWLSKLSRSEQENEIDQSLRFLDRIGGNRNEWTLCYPYGDYNSDLISLLERRGCKLALTTRVDIANIENDTRYTLPRLDTNDIPKNKNAQPNDWYR